MLWYPFSFFPFLFFLFLLSFSFFFAYFFLSFWYFLSLFFSFPFFLFKFPILSLDFLAISKFRRFFLDFFEISGLELGKVRKSGFSQNSRFRDFYKFLILFQFQKLSILRKYGNMEISTSRP